MAIRLSVLLLHTPCPLHPPSPPCSADAQPSSFQLTMGRVEPGPAGYVEVRNPNDFAVDVSSYALRGAVNFVFAPGERKGAGWGLGLACGCTCTC